MQMVEEHDEKVYGPCLLKYKCEPVPEETSKPKYA